MNKLHTKTRWLLYLLWRPFFLLFCYFSPTRIAKIGEYKIKVKRNWGYHESIETVVANSKHFTILAYGDQRLFFALKRWRPYEIDERFGCKLYRFDIGVWGVLVSYGEQGFYVSGELETIVTPDGCIKLPRGRNMDMNQFKESLLFDIQDCADYANTVRT